MPLLELPRLEVREVRGDWTSVRPVLVNCDPGPGETNVPLDAVVALELVDVQTVGIDLAATEVTVGGVPAVKGGRMCAAFAGPRSDWAEGMDSLRIVLDPTAPFASQAEIVVRVLSATLDGERLDETYAFTVEDRTAPRLVAAQAIGPRQVRLGFDEPVQVQTLGGFVFTALDAPAVPVVAVSASVDGPTVTLLLDRELTPDVAYRVSASGLVGDEAVLDLSGNPVLAPFDRVDFAGFRPARPAARRFDLWSMLPKHNRRADATGDLRRFIACLQEVTDLQLADIDRATDVFDLERAPEPFLDALLQDLGDPFAFDLDTLSKRRLASVLVEMYRQKGTLLGIANAIRFFLGVDVQAIQPFAGTTLVLGESELDLDWELGPSDRFARYAFDLVVGVVLTPTQRRQIRALVEYLKPAHTHFVDLVEPGPTPGFDHWELGLSDLGDTTLLH